MCIQLRDALKAEQTLSGLLPIAEQLDAKLSFWGTRYVVIEPKNNQTPLGYSGTAPLDALLNRIEEIINASGKTTWFTKDFTPSEHKECQLLENEINRFYITDINNLKKSSLITRLFVTFWNVFFDYQYAWHDDIWGRDSQIIRRNSDTVWKDDVQKYESAHKVKASRLKWLLGPFHGTVWPNLPPR